MDANDLAGLGWLLGLWQDAVVTLITATEPLFSAIGSVSGSLVAASGFAWLCLLFFRMADVGLLRGLLAGFVIFFLISAGMQPSVVQVEGRAAVKMTALQAISLNVAMAVYGAYGGAMAQVLKNQTVAGSIIPSEAATRDAVERNAATFGDTDLARLIRDYNAQCSPSAAVVASGIDTPVDAYHAIGLLGGGGLGIPDESASLIEQIKKGAMAAFWSSSGPTYSWIFGTDAMSGLHDARAINERRAAGIQALEAEGRGFVTIKNYYLPSQSSWEATFAGTPDAKPSYLVINDAPGDLSTKLADSAHAFPQGDRGSSQAFAPSDCVSAYRTAQFAAEQAYNALEAVGKNASGGQAASSESGVVGAGLAWQRLLSRTLSGTGEVTGGGIGFASGVLAAVQAGKDYMGWLDLQTLLPAYVAGMAGLFWLILIICPIVLLVSPLLGIQIVTRWFSLLIGALLSIIFAQLIAVGASLMLAGVAAGQAAAASGWMGDGADLDLIRGGLGMVAGVLLVVSTWLAGVVSGVSFSGLGGVSAGVATTTQVAGMVSSFVSSVVSIGTSKAMTGGSKPKTPSTGGYKSKIDGMPRPRR